MISIIVPLFNERENVLTYNDRLFPSVDAIGKEFGEPIEYIMVDDGSRDDTLKILQQIQEKRRDIVVVSHGRNRGMGAAIKTGIDHSKGDLIVTIDSDLTFRPHDIHTLVKAYRETAADCVSGSPYLEKHLMKEVSIHRLGISKSVNLLYRLLLGDGITCVSPIFRLYKRTVLDELTIESNNFEINAEIISKLIIKGKRIVEVPVELHKREHGESKIVIQKEIKNNIVLLSKIFKTKYLHAEWN